MVETSLVPVELRSAVEADFSPIMAADTRAFHGTYSEKDEQFARQTLELERFVVGQDGDDIVAIAGAYSLEITLPGGAIMPMAGITWVGVTVTHRRRGLLRQMMAMLDQQSADRGEPLLGLNASEGAIYARFGYGSINQMRGIHIDRRDVVLRDSIPPTSVRIVAAGDAIGAMAERWDRYRKLHPGEVSRTEADVRRRVHEAGSGGHLALHDDGYAMWTSANDWTNGLPAARVDVLDFCAATSTAHAALWQTLLSIDLVGVIVSDHVVIEDDLLSSLVINPRAIQTRSLYDCLWLKVADPQRCFAARSYRTDDRLTIATANGSFEVTATGCGPTDRLADLTLAPSAIGPLLMGGVSATHLSSLGLIEAAPEVLGRADAFFGWSPRPITRGHF